MNDTLLVLGIDPGTATTGYGIIRCDGMGVDPVTYGTITTPASSPLPQRLQRLYRALKDLIQAHHPNQAAVEELFFARNARTALSVGHARGVVLLALAEAGLSVHGYAPLQVKRAITGYGRASKEQMQKMVRLLLGLESTPQPDDVADALAVAICHAYTFSTMSRLLDDSQETGREP